MAGMRVTGKGNRCCAGEVRRDRRADTAARRGQRCAKASHSAHIFKIIAVCLSGCFHNPRQGLQGRVIDDAAEPGAADEAFSNMPVPVSMRAKRRF